MNQNRIAIHTSKNNPKNIGFVNVKTSKIKIPGIIGNHAKKPINPASEFNKNNIYNNHIILISIPPIIPNLT